MKASGVIWPSAVLCWTAAGVGGKMFGSEWSSLSRRPCGIARRTKGGPWTIDVDKVCCLDNRYNNSCSTRLFGNFICCCCFCSPESSSSTSPVPSRRRLTPCSTPFRNRPWQVRQAYKPPRSIYLQDKI